MCLYRAYGRLCKQAGRQPFRGQRVAGFTRLLPEAASGAKKPFRERSSDKASLTGVLVTRLYNGPGDVEQSGRLSLAG